MSFSTFCNICFIKEHIIKLCVEEYESIFNILISFTSSTETVNSIIYLCTNCCNKLEEYSKFRELFLTNFVRFRYLYNEHKKQLEIYNVPDIEKQLKTFVDVNVERPNGTPLIESYGGVHILRNNTGSNVDICKGSDGEFIKKDLDILVNKNESSRANPTFSSEINISKNETQSRYEKYENDCFNEDQGNIPGSSVYIKAEPNPDQFEESHEELVTDTDIPRHESADNYAYDLPTKSEKFATDDTTNEEGHTEYENKATTSDTVCNVCDERFACQSDLEVHMGAHTGEKHYFCEECHKQFTDTSSFIRHKCLHSGKRPYKCDECGLGFGQRYDLKRHKLTHTGEKPYSCDECQKTFAESSTLIKHKRIHSGEKPYKCDECGMGFAQRSTLNTHKRTHTGEKPYKCDECGMGFSQRFNLNSHKRTHTGEKPYSCDECEKKFTHCSTLIKHKRVHSGEKPYKCDECGMGFGQQSDLKRHKLTHTGEKPYSCDECEKTFADNSYLTIHKRFHSGEKPFKCDECGLGFLQRFTLKRHKRTHTGERPFSCDQCRGTFTQFSNLKKHKRIHSGERK